ncbi:brain-specific angiogenesis inhibitor 1-associated protein 2-like protein 2 [Seriola dumerili]|nr:brain-specific angiogenesis inhibitor 1-associated protein 2-like protein 2 [Seriola dumerili]
MSRMNSDQLYRSTLGIYSNLMDEFNPSLQKLVSLGNSYIQAFKGITVTSEAYFSALSKIGETAFHTVSSRSLGDVLIQISESQRRLTMELDGVFRWFSVEVLQEMDNNIRLDKDYISSSRNHYEVEVHNQTAALERHLRRGTNQDCSQYVQFLRESHGEALKEEERRYRFLAEKHSGLIQTIARLMNKTGDSLQQRADVWTKEVNVTRQPEARGPAPLDNTAGIKREEIGKSREEPPLGKIPSRAPSPQGSMFRSAVDSAGGGGGGRSMRALVAHQPAGSSPTLLPFTRGEMITVLVQQPRNGWLYGRADSSSRQGWFPASYVEPVDEPPRSSSSSFSSSSLRGGSSSSNLFTQMGSSSLSGAGSPPPPPPPPPPPSSSLSSNKHFEMPPLAPTPDRRVESTSENKRSQPHGSQPELFPRGTNPFATVKLKPTSTDDRSAPRLYRR